MGLTLTDDAREYVQDRARDAATAARILGTPLPDPATAVDAMTPALIAHLTYLWGGDPSRAIRPDTLIAAYVAALEDAR